MNKSRLTVIDTLYHQLANKQPTSAQCMFSRELASSEEPVQRGIVVGKEWQKLETYWLTTIGMMKLTNEEGKFWQVNPTPEELKEAMSRHVVIGFGTSPGIMPAIVVPPKESARFMPLADTPIWLRCLGGPAHCNVTLYPV